jgi:hypothetical protein
MKRTDKAVKALRESVLDARDEAKMRQYLEILAKFAYTLAKQMDIDEHEIVSYALVRLGCTIGTEIDDRTPGSIALAECWPDVFRHCTREEYEAMLAEKFKDDTEPRRRPSKSRVGRQIFSRAARTDTDKPASS